MHKNRSKIYQTTRKFKTCRGVEWREAKEGAQLVPNDYSREYRHAHCICTRLMACASVYILFHANGMPSQPP